MVFVHNDCLGGLLSSSCVPGGMVMDEIDTCIEHTNAKCFFPVPLCTDRYEGSCNCHVNHSKLAAHFILKGEGRQWLYLH